VIRALAVVALLGCSGKPSPQEIAADCRKVVMNTPLRLLHKLDFVHACRRLFLPVCDQAMTDLAEPTRDTLPAVITACRKAYPDLAVTLEPRDFFAAALERAPDLDENDRGIIAGVLVMDLAPPAHAVLARVHPDSIELEHIGSWKVSPTPTAEELAPILAAAIAHGAGDDGIVVRGSKDAPEVYKAFATAIGKAPIAGIVNCLPDNSNCR
jgi:hypothetical protein